MIFKSLAEIATITMGQSPESKYCNYISKGKPLLNGPTEFGDFHPKPVQYCTSGNRVSNKGDILFCVRGSTTGRMNWADQEYVLGRGLASIRHIAGEDFNHFLRYLIDYHLDSILKMTGGSTFPNLTRDNLNAYKLFLPKESSQLSINKFLRNIDSKIELNNRINVELEAMAKTLYDYWFVQFDFPMSKAYAEKIGKPELAGKPYKSSGGKMIYNTELKREIPEGWEVKALGDWIEKEKAGDWGKESNQGNYQTLVSCIRGTDINGLHGKGNFNPPTRYILEKNQNKLLQANDIVIEISGGSPTQSTGRMAYFTESIFERVSNQLICSNFCKAISLKEHRQFFYFAYAWNMLYDNDILFGWEGKTSGIKNLLFDSFIKHYFLPQPPDIILERFNAFVTPIEAAIQKNLKQNDQLASLRDWLLPMLMNGQVSVNEAHDKAVKKAEEKINIAAEGAGEYGKKEYD
jgi:type I restriction enzyme S subunit